MSGAAEWLHGPGPLPLFELHVCRPGGRDARAVATRIDCCATETTERCAYADIVLFHSDTPQRIKPDQLSAAAMGLWINLTTNPTDAGSGATATERAGRLFLTWEDLKLNLPIQPAKARDQQTAFSLD